MKSFGIRIFKGHSENLRKLAANITNLMLAQGVNFIFSLLLIPYLIRTIGISNFGLVATSQAVITYLTLFVDYGFYASATQAVVTNRASRTQLGNILGEVLAARLLLMLVSLLLLGGLCILVKPLRDDAALYLFSFSIVVSRAVFPIWFFQGLEKMSFLAVFNVASKVIIGGAFSLVVQNPTDYQYVNLLLGTGELLMAMASLSVIFCYWKYPLTLPKKHRVIFQLKDNWHLFLSNFSVNAYINSNIIILGFFASKQVVGYYGIA